jgi:hypothetical protein
MPRRASVAGPERLADAFAGLVPDAPIHMGGNP